MQAEIIKFERIKDEFSQLNIAQIGSGINFEPKRLIWLDGFESGKHGRLRGKRKSKASKLCKQIVIPVRGSFVSVVRHFEKPDVEKVFYLANPSEGLYFPPMAWRSIQSVSGGAVLLVICSELHDESDWIRDLDEWRDRCDQIQST